MPHCKLPRAVFAAATLSVAFLASPVSPLFSAPEQQKTLDEERREVDELLRRVDNVELGKASLRILRFAERLLKEKGDREAQPYFEKGLTGNAWALEQQLTLGEIRSRAGEPDALRDKAEMVLRIGEEDAVLERASRLLGRALPDAPTPVMGIKETGTVLVLLPIGDGNTFILPALRDGLSRRLGIKVLVGSHEVPLPKAERTAKTQWVKRTREQILKTLMDRPALVSQLKQWGFTVDQLRTDDQSLVAFVRKTVAIEHGATEVQTLDSMLTAFENTPQWDATTLLAAIQAALGNHIGPKQLVLGITQRDLFGGTSNFLFGTASTGNFLGIVSSHRFRAAFNSEAPMRARLIERLVKQSLSSIGFMLGVQRCTTPDCARAYPQNLAEHDQKPSTLCSACRTGIERALGQKLPADSN